MFLETTQQAGTVSGWAEVHRNWDRSSLQGIKSTFTKLLNVRQRCSFHACTSVCVCVFVCLLHFNNRVYQTCELIPYFLLLCLFSTQVQTRRRPSCTDAHPAAPEICLRFTTTLTCAHVHSHTHTQKHTPVTVRITCHRISRIIMV